MSIESLPISVDPSFEVVRPEVVQEQADQANDYLKIGILLGAAFITWRTLLKDNAPPLTDPTPVTINEALKHTVMKFAPTWLKLTSPGIEKAYQLGSHGGLDPEEVSYLARVYANEMGDYINQTSAQAVLEGFNALVNKRWSPQIAYQRAIEGIGLSPPQMRQYISAMENLDTKYLPNSVTDDPRVKETLTKLLSQRSLSIGENEAYTVQEMGRQLMWMKAADEGLIHPDSRRMWRTAEDERTCEICRPMNENTVGINEKFVVKDSEYWVPAVHPNCRCKVELIEPEEFSKAYDPQEHPRGGNTRNKGQFSRTWGQRSQVKQRDSDADRIVDEILAQALSAKKMPMDLKSVDLKSNLLQMKDLKHAVDLKDSTATLNATPLKVEALSNKTFTPVAGLTLPEAIMLHYKSKPSLDFSASQPTGEFLPVDGLYTFEYQPDDYSGGELIEGRSISHPFVDRQDIATEMANDYADHIKESIYGAVSVSPQLAHKFHAYLEDELSTVINDMDNHELEELAREIGEEPTDVYENRDLVTREIRAYLMEPYVSEVPQSHHDNAQYVIGEHGELMDAHDLAVHQVMVDLLESHDPATSEAARHLIPEIFPQGVPYDEGGTTVRALIPTIYVVEDITEAATLDGANVDMGFASSRQYVLDGNYEVTHVSYDENPTAFPTVQMVFLRRADGIEKRFDPFGVLHLAVKRAM